MAHHVKENKIKYLLRHRPHDEILFHHRLSTSTIDTRNACHPFSTKQYFKHNYVGAHNGVLSNEDILEKEHKELGIEYISRQSNGTFNDSEALIWDLARYFEGEVDKVTAQGSIAFIVVQNDQDGNPENLYFGTNRGSLNMEFTEGGLMVSSEGPGGPVPNDVLHTYNYKEDKLTTRPLKIQHTYTSIYTGGPLPAKKTPWYGDGWDDDTDYIPNRETDDGYLMRIGPAEEIVKDLLLDNSDTFSAYVAAEIELDELKLEIANTNDKVQYAKDSEIQGIVNEWIDLSSYAKVMKLVVEMLSSMHDEELKGGVPARELGFHG